MKGILDLIHELAHKQAKIEVPALRQRLRAIIAIFPSLAKLDATNSPAGNRFRAKKATIPVDRISGRFKREQAKHTTVKKPKSPGRRRQAARMRALHRDPAWRRKNKLPPPKK